MTRLPPSRRALRRAPLLAVLASVPAAACLAYPAVVPAGAATMVAAGAATVKAAAAGYFHGYGVVGIGPKKGLTAISEYRPDEAIKVPAGTHCTTPYTGTPAYTTEWINDGNGDWLEIGTGHQCGGAQYWYAGYGLADSWYSLWTKRISKDAGHTFWIQGSVALNEKYYTFNIDSTQRTSTFLDLTAPYDETGLESYSARTTAPAYDMTKLKYAANFSLTWHSWAKTVLVAHDKPLCARVKSATHGVAGEHANCSTAASSAATRSTAVSNGPAGSGAAGARRALSAAGPGTSAAAPAPACAPAVDAWHAQSLRHAYRSTAGAVQAWRESRLPGVRPVFPAQSPSAAAAAVDVCYLGGTFTGIPSAPGGPAAYTGLIVLVNKASGELVLDAASPGGWPFGPPPAS